MKMAWFMYAVVAMIAFSVMFLLNKFVLNKGVSSQLLLFYTGIFLVVITGIQILTRKESFHLGSGTLIFIIAIAVFSFIGNFFILNSINISPNPGYSLAVSGVHILIVALVSIVLFKSELTVVKGIGVLLSVIGIVLLGLE